MQKITDSNPVSVQCGVAGYVSMYKIHRDKITGFENSDELVAKSEKLTSFKNLILNQGLNDWMLNSTVACMSFCAVGTGSTAPLVTDTGLATELTRTSTRVDISPSPALVGSTYEYATRQQYTFPLGGVVGNIAEIGVGRSAGPLVTRALIKDALGDPTVITVGAEEQLIVIYTLVKVIPTASSAGVLTIDVNDIPTDYTIEIKPSNLGATDNFYFFSGTRSLSDSVTVFYVFETQTLGAVTGSPSGTSLAGDQVTSAYVADTFYRNYTVTAGLTQCNFASGIGSAAFLMGSFAATFAAYQVSFTPKIPKNAGRLLSIPIRLSWTRI